MNLEGADAQRGIERSGGGREDGPTDPTITAGEYADAAILSTGAIALMVHRVIDSFYITMMVARDQEEAEQREWMQARQQGIRDVLRDTCEHLNSAMEVVGEYCNGVDAVDEYGMTDAAFDAIHRVLDGGPSVSTPPAPQDSPCASSTTPHSGEIGGGV